MTTPAAIGCSWPDCQQTARGRVAAPVLLDANLGDQHGFVIIPSAPASRRVPRIAWTTFITRST